MLLASLCWLRHLLAPLWLSSHSTLQGATCRHLMSGFLRSWIVRKSIQDSFSSSVRKVKTMSRRNPDPLLPAEVEYHQAVGQAIQKKLEAWQTGKNTDLSDLPEVIEIWRQQVHDMVEEATKIVAKQISRRNRQWLIKRIQSVPNYGDNTKKKLIQALR